MSTRTFFLRLTPSIALLALWGHACREQPLDRPEDPEDTGSPTVDPGPSQTPPPRALPLRLFALRGDQTALWTSRNLAPLERLIAVSASGERLALQPSAPGLWLDEGDRVEWQVLGPGDRVLARAQVQALRAEHDGEMALLLDPGQLGSWTSSWSQPPAGAPPLGLYLSLDQPDQSAVWLDAQGQTLTAPEPLYCGGLDLCAVELVGGSSVARASTLTLSLAFTALPERPLMILRRELIETGRGLAWGDLHSHSNLSADGCELPDQSCLYDGPAPGELGFERAAENGLDFAAITEHAEWSVYTRDDLGICLEIWAESQDRAQRAEGGPTLPFLGMEWTSLYEGGGHRTVIFEDLSLCEAFQVGASSRGSDLQRPNGVEHYTPQSTRVARTPEALEQGLRSAEEVCGPSRWVSYFHHPAVGRPVAVDWSHENNSAVADTVLEIYSEHGSSECSSLEAEGCTWRVQADQHRPEGAAQTALSLGYRLGFVGGTDNHGDNPGGVEAGPSTSFGTLGMTEQAFTGGLTGVWVPVGGTLSRTVVLDAINTRSTLAASRRFDRVQVILLDDDGQPVPPGSVLEQTPRQATLLVVVEDAQASAMLLELVNAQGEVLHAIEGGRWQLTLDLQGQSAVYLRARAWDEDGVEDRIWVSPWFFEG